MEVDESNWTYPPESILDDIFDRLALADLRTASRVCQSWRERASLAASRWDRRSLTATRFQCEPVLFICADVLPVITPRQLHASCYHPKTGMVYVFGGKVPTERSRTHFNDLWSFDLARRRWNHVEVQGTQFPMPKSRCSLVAYGYYYLLLVGGSHYVQNPRNVQDPRTRSDAKYTREIHRFDIRKKEWTEMWSDSKAPGISDHSSVVFQDFLIVIGTKHRRAEEDKYHKVHVIDLMRGSWHEPPVRNEGPRDSRRYWFDACTAVLLRPGYILLHPATKYTDFRLMPEENRSNRKCVAYLLHFDPNDLTKEWRREMIPSGMDQVNFDVDAGLGQIGVVHVNNKARLLHLVSAKRKEVGEASEMVRRMEAFHATVRTALHDHIKSKEDIARFLNSLSTEPFRIEDERNAYILSPGESGHQSDVQVTVEPLHPYDTQVSPAELDLNTSFIKYSFLPAALRSDGWSLLEQTIRLHSRTDYGEMILFAANLDRVEEEKQLRWTLCEMRGEAPPVTECYSFVSAGGQMVLHGGCFERGSTSSDVHHSGGTYILDPVGS